MSEIEKMQRYIERTKLTSNSRFNMDIAEAFALAEKARDATDIPFDAINIAFQYGRAKGYRAAKAEARR